MNILLGLKTGEVIEATDYIPRWSKAGMISMSGYYLPEYERHIPVNQILSIAIEDDNLSSLIRVSG